MKEVETQNWAKTPESGVRVKKQEVSLLDRGVKHLCGTNLGRERGDVLVSQASTHQLGCYVKVSRGRRGPIPLLLSFLESSYERVGLTASGSSVFKR